MTGPIYSLAHRDRAEAGIVRVFRDAGATVLKHSGKDEPDLFVGFHGAWHAVEVKSGDKAKLSPGQIE